MKKKPGLTDDPSRLLDDEQLADLMEAEYLASGIRAGRAELDRGFEALSAKLKKTQHQRLWAGPLTMAAMLMICLAPWLLEQQTQNDGIKGIDTGLPVALYAYVLGAGGRLTAVSAEPLKAGDTVVFKVSMSASGFAAIAIAEGAGQAIVRFESGPIEAGEGRIVEKGGQAYAYRIDGDEPSLRVCALAGTTEAEVQGLLANLHEHFERLAGTACVAASVASP